MRLESQTGERNPLDFIHFALCFGGFLLAAGGIVLSWPALAIAGALLMLVALAYFLAAGSGSI